MKFKIILTLLLIVLIIPCASAEVETTQQVVKVYDGVTGIPLQAVKVNVNNNDYYTEFNGKTPLINAIIGETYIYTLSKDGYQTQTAQITSVKPTIAINVLNALGTYQGYTTYLLPNGVDYPESNAPSILKTLEFEFERYMQNLLSR